MDYDSLIYTMLEEEGKFKKTLKGAGKLLGTAAATAVGVAGGIAAHKRYEEYHNKKALEDALNQLGDINIFHHAN